MLKVFKTTVIWKAAVPKRPALILGFKVYCKKFYCILLLHYRANKICSSKRNFLKQVDKIKTSCHGIDTVLTYKLFNSP